MDPDTARIVQVLARSSKENTEQLQLAINALQEQMSEYSKIIAQQMMLLHKRIEVLENDSGTQSTGGENDPTIDEPCIDIP